jgi:hypothetical protein
MSGVELERAIRALRASGSGTRLQRESIRARVLFAASNRGRVKRILFRWALPLAATLVISSAWAASLGYLGRPWRALRGVFGIHDAAPPAPIGRAERAMPAMAEQVQPHLTIDDLPLAPATPEAPRRARGSRPPTTSSASASFVTAPAEADALYAAAHRAHFVDRDPIAAIAAWDAYLRVAPDGLLAPEARYNRALALVRVGRHSEASAALRAFVEGRYGGYRQREATQIVEALEITP